MSTDSPAPQTIPLFNTDRLDPEWEFSAYMLLRLARSTILSEHIVVLPNGDLVISTSCANAVPFWSLCEVTNAHNSRRATGFVPTLRPPLLPAGVAGVHDLASQIYGATSTDLPYASYRCMFTFSEENVLSRGDTDSRLHFRPAEPVGYGYPPPHVLRLRKGMRCYVTGRNGLLEDGSLHTYTGCLVTVLEFGDQFVKVRVDEGQREVVDVHRQVLAIYDPRIRRVIDRVQFPLVPTNQRYLDQGVLTLLSSTATLNMIRLALPPQDRMTRNPALTVDEECDDYAVGMLDSVKDSPGEEVIMLPNGDLVTSRTAERIAPLPTEPQVSVDRGPNPNHVFFLADAWLPPYKGHLPLQDCTRWVHFAHDIPVPSQPRVPPSRTHDDADDPLGFWAPPPRVLRMDVGDRYYLIGRRGLYWDHMNATTHNAIVQIVRFHNNGEVEVKLIPEHVRNDDTPTRRYSASTFIVYQPETCLTWERRQLPFVREEDIGPARSSGTMLVEPDFS
ncbi:hypothetical protein BV25DRAFT_1843460 [Artomyces pyxidatus]|uniref:Uncharacterized protein n=1 Tax=Artomyces pyxidatus TaxID=48021 RepID=A0ACB8SFN2_9AGAM|nr:hypothetical protein BV25DRAFT_1843460 [Artomyces pyxidatus]